MITLYGITTCGTCRKARQWLDGEGIAHTYHDFRKDGLDATRVSAWLGELGVDGLVNRRGTTWRKLDDPTRGAIEAGDADVIAANPTVIKRPLIDTGAARLIGFKDDVQAALKADAAAGPA